MEKPVTIHDFGGFPQALFEVHYPAPGAPAVAEALAAQLHQPHTRQPLGLDEHQWGLDHGTWSVLKPMFPQANIPVLQLSMDYSRQPAEHLALGQQLHSLREQGVLIVGSGNIVHNLGAMHRTVSDTQAHLRHSDPATTPRRLKAITKTPYLASWASMPERARSARTLFTSSMRE
jgi:4,5-DOPA dioxygenase extradiol